jgi:hypothetical protein
MEGMMGFSWDRIGSFATKREADEWCERHNVDPRDRDIVGGRDGFDLLVRQGTTDDERPDGARW